MPAGRSTVSPPRRRRGVRTTSSLNQNAARLTYTKRRTGAGERGDDSQSDARKEAYEHGRMEVGGGPARALRARRPPGLVSGAHRAGHIQLAEGGIVRPLTAVATGEAVDSAVCARTAPGRRVHDAVTVSANISRFCYSHAHSLFAQALARADAKCLYAAFVSLRGVRHKLARCVARTRRPQHEHR